MNSSRSANIRAAVGGMYFAQLAVVLYLFINTASVEIDESYSVFGTAQVAEGSSAWIHLENSDTNSGRLTAADSISVTEEGRFARSTAHTSVGPIDVIEIHDARDGQEIRFEHETPWGELLGSTVVVRAAQPQPVSSIWEGESELRSFNSVVTGYDDEGVHWRDSLVGNEEASPRLHVAVEGGTIQALMDNRVYFAATDSSGTPLGGVRVSLLRNSLDGETSVDMTTNRLGLAMVTIRPRHTEDWTVALRSSSERVLDEPTLTWRAKVVPARDGIIVRPRTSPIVSEATVPIDISMQGTRGTAFALTRCTDQTHNYTIGGLPGGDSVAELEVPPTVVDGIRICRVQIATAAGYRNVPRSLTSYVSVDGDRLDPALVVTELLPAAARSFAPSPLSEIDMDGWTRAVGSAGGQELTELARFLLASAPIAYEPLDRLYTSREDIVAGLESYRSTRLRGLRWLLVGELLAGIALILAFVIPAQRRTSLALQELDDDEEGFDGIGATRGSVVIFWGLMVLVMSTVVAGFVFLFSIIG